MQHDAVRFIESIRINSWPGMLHAVEGALVRLSLSRKQTASEAQNEIAFTRFLVAARNYLLSEGRVRPKHLDDGEFLLLRPLCEHLVHTGRFPPGRLELFALEPWQRARQGQAKDPASGQQDN